MHIFSDITNRLPFIFAAKEKKTSSIPVSSGAVVVVIVWKSNLQLPIQSVPITTKFVSSSPAYGEVYSIHHYVIQFVSDMWQVGSFLQVLRFPLPIKLTGTI